MKLAKHTEIMEEVSSEVEFRKIKEAYMELPSMYASYDFMYASYDLWIQLCATSMAILPSARAAEVDMQLCLCPLR